MNNPIEDGSARTISELPSGFVWKDLAYCRGKIPMPQDWHFRQDPTSQYIRAFFITREEISGQPSVQTSDTTFFPIDTTGFFQTGFTIYVHRDAPYLFKAKPSELVERFANQFDLHEPEGDPVVFSEGNRLTARRFFRSKESNPLGLIVPPTKLHMEASGNDSTGTFYLTTFETPAEKWPEDKEIARVMIENRVFAQDF